MQCLCVNVTYNALLLNTINTIFCVCVMASMCVNNVIQCNNEMANVCVYNTMWEIQYNVANINAMCETTMAILLMSINNVIII